MGRCRGPSDPCWQGGRCGSFSRSSLGSSGSNSVVECDLAKVEVAGSNPVSRSIFYLPSDLHIRFDGAVAKW